MSYANVVATLALFVALGSGAYAAINLPKNSVGTPQLKRGAVTKQKIRRNSITRPKIARNAVTGAKVRMGSLTGLDVAAASITTADLANGAVNSAKVIDSSLTGRDVADGSLTGSDINQGSLNNVRASNVTAISITNDGGCSPALSLPSGVSSDRLGGGICKLTFPSPITGCVANATVHYRPEEGILLLGDVDRSAALLSSVGKPNDLEVHTYVNEMPTNLPFDLVLVC